MREAYITAVYSCRVDSFFTCSFKAYIHYTIYLFYFKLLFSFILLCGTMFFSQLYLGQVLELKNEANANLPKIAVATWGWLQEQINPHRIPF